MGLLDAPALTKQQADARYISATRLRVGNLLSRLSNNPSLGAVAPTDNQPTITTGTGYTVTSLFQAAGIDSGQVAEVGSRGSWDNTNTRWNVSGSGTTPGIDFYLAGDSVEFGLTPQTTSTLVWIFVDGQPLTTAPTTYTTSVGAGFYFKLVFPTVGRRRVEVFSTSITAWYALRTTYANLISPAPRRPAVAFVGDSFFAGSAAATPFQSTPFLAARLLGVEPINVSFGGTGYVAPGSFNTFGSAARVAAVTKFTPELIVMSGSVNDDTQTGRQAAASAAYADYATALPNARIIVFGPQPSQATDTISTNRQANNAAIKAAALAAPNVLAFHDMIGTADALPATWSSSTTYNTGDTVTYKGSVWRVITSAGMTVSGSGQTPGSVPRWRLITYAFTGTGRVGTTASDGTRDTFLSSDGVHPMPEGNAALTLRQTADVRADLLAAASA